MGDPNWKLSSIGNLLRITHGAPFLNIRIEVTLAIVVLHSEPIRLGLFPKP